VRKLLKMILGILVLAVIPSPSSARTLWQDTVVGMSPNDVIKLYPDSRQTVVDGVDSLIKMERITIFNSNFLVVFGFKNAKLFRVELSASDMLNSRDLKNPSLVYLQLSDELTKRYGVPINIDKSLLVDAESKYFLSNGISVSLKYMKIKSSLISINYSLSTGGENAL
jgi:hypothetical protein